MANFLTRMAGRALGVTPVAQPFVPAMFNPAFGLAKREAAGDAAPEPRAAANPPAAPPLSQTQPSFTPATLPQVVSLSPPRSSPAGHEDRPPVSSITVPLARPAFTAPNASPDPVPNPTRPHPPVSIFGSPSAPNRGLPPEIIRTATSEPPVVRPPARGSTAVSRHVSATAASPGLSVRAPRSAAALETQGPVIRVSIGRIDVRAQFSAAPAPPPKSARPPALSLDEYLKQRSEGRR